MYRFSCAIIVSGCCLGLLPSCSHMVESRVIQAFSESLEKEDLAKLRKTTSDEFDEKALNGDASLAAIKQLEIPTGKVKIVKVVDKGEDEKRVSVTVGENNRKLLFKLERDEKTNKWVVADLFLTKKELQANKPVSLQLSLLLGLREFLEAWKSGDRDQVLETSTPEFAKILRELPPENLAEMTRMVAGEAHEHKGTSPAADIGEETATVSLPKLSGDLVIAFRKVEDRWRADNVSVIGRRDGEGIPSVRHVVSVTSATLAFQKAYNVQDKKGLSEICTPRFFDGCLSAANLSLVQLPAPNAKLGEAEIKLDGKMANYVIRTKSDVVKITLVRETEEEPNAPPVYRVEDVTIYELSGKQDKRLSALFTSHAVMQLFSEALVARDLESLRLNSTHEFNNRIWKRLTPETMARLPLLGIYASPPEIINTVFQGPITQVTVNQGPGPLTYVLRDQSGRVSVDDVLVPALDRPESLRSGLETMIPILDFTAAFKAKNIETARGNSSKEFCRLVWNQTDDVPDMQNDPTRYLETSLTKISLLPDRALVTLGDDQFGAKVLLIKEREHYVIDDVVLVSGIAASERQSLKQAIRRKLQGREVH